MQRAAWLRGVAAGSIMVASTIVALALPVQASGGNASGSIAYVNLHERIPYAHVRVIVPQMRSTRSGAARANRSLRLSAEGLALQWESYLANRMPEGRGGPGRPAGTFDVLPRPGLTSSSPLLVDSLLAVRAVCSGCTGTQYWSPDAALLPSGNSVRLYRVLFTSNRRALQTVARQIRWLYVHAYPAPNACVTQMRAKHVEAPSIAVLVHGIALSQGLALEANGLEVGYNAGYLYNDACGLAPFLVPYRPVLALTTALGRRLIESFAGEPSPWNRTGLLPAAFPRPIAQALALVARRAHFPAEGPVQRFQGLVPSVDASANANSYGVGYYPCSPALPLNSAKLGSCIKANYDIWGGFGGRAFISHKKALQDLLACSVWTCELRVSVCPATSRHTVVDGQRVAYCSFSGRRGPTDEISWAKGTWTFIVQPPCSGGWRGQVAEVVAEERPLHLSHFPGVLQNDPGCDNNNTSIEWTVGRDDYYVSEYGGGGLANALSFRTFKL